MSARARVLGEFADAWNAGARPRVRDHLARLPAGPERDALADELGAWLETAVPPDLTPSDRDAIRADPRVARALGAAALWPEQLPRLRARAGLDVEGMAAALVAGLGAGGPAATERAAAYLREMESGARGPDRVSRRLLDALGRLLGVGGGALADLGGGPPRAVLQFRGDDDEELAAQLDALARAASRPAPPAPRDELDRLFDGGPDA